MWLPGQAESDVQKNQRGHAYYKLKLRYAVCVQSSIGRSDDQSVRCSGGSQQLEAEYLPTDLAGGSPTRR